MGYSLVLGGGPQFVRGFPPHLFLGVLPRVYYKHPNLGVILLSCLSCLRVLQHQFCLFTSLFLFIFVLCFWRFTEEEEEEDHYILLLLFDVTKT